MRASRSGPDGGAGGPFPPHTRAQMARAVAGVLYLGYMLLVSLAFFLVTGAVGFLACFWFVRTIYAAIKID